MDAIFLQNLTNNFTNKVLIIACAIDYFFVNYPLINLLNLNLEVQIIIILIFALLFYRNHGYGNYLIYLGI
jgi:hypothetical protein